MVFHITNYMRETNVWMIRKCRWMLWTFCMFVPIYRNVYWDFHARRVGWKSWFDFRSEKQKAEDAKTQKGMWGYKPRYEPVYDFSLKKRKYDSQTRSEQVRDTPRLFTTSGKYESNGVMDPKKVRTLTYILREHNRVPGSFDYNYDQDFYSCYTDIDFDAYVTLGSNQRKGIDEIYQYAQGHEE